MRPTQQVLPLAYRLLGPALTQLQAREDSFGAAAPDASLQLQEPALQEILQQLATRLTGNYPFHHPAYAGQMLKPPHPLAWAAYALAMAINPNNHALDGGPATSLLEKEVIAALAQAFGFAQPMLGHLTSSGTIANLEALWVARQLHPGKAIAYSASAHYTHSRMCALLGVEGIAVEVTAAGQLNLDQLAQLAPRIGTLVVTLGTTGMGQVEPLQQIMPLAKAHGIRLHGDAAYGGFFYLIKDSGLLDAAPWQALSALDSLVVDPHKHGLQPYGCGCVLFRDAGVGKLYLHDSPYAYFSSDELHLGEISLECSRAGAAAAALWATLQLLPPTQQGLGEVLLQCRRAALNFAAALQQSKHYHLVAPPQLDIVVYAPKPSLATTSAISQLSQQIFTQGMNLPPIGALYLSLLQLPAESFCALVPDYTADSDQVTVLRSVLMKPEHLAFVPTLMARLEELYTQPPNVPA